MTNQEILEKAIQKAIDGGCKLFDIPNWAVSDEDGELYFGSLVKFEGQEWFSEDYEVLRAETIIFNHDFAKSLWGEARDIESYNYYLEGELFDTISPEKYEEIPEDDREANWFYYTPNYKNKGWQHHLQMMVVADDSIKYLGKNL